MTPRVWWCSIWRWRARMNQSRTWLLASILASSLFIVAVRANSETGDEKSWQTKAVMRGWAGLGWARWRAHTQSCRGVNACHRHLQHLQHCSCLNLFCSHHDMQLQFEDVTAVWRYLQTICSCDGQQLKMWHNHKLQCADMTHETETKLQNNLSTLLNWWKDRIKKTIFYIYI